MFPISSLLASIDIVFGMIYLFHINETRRSAVTVKKILIVQHVSSFLYNMRPAPKATTLYILVHASDSIPPVRYIAQYTLKYCLAY